MSLDTLVRSHTPQDIVGGLPAGEYVDFYQPTYPDETALTAAVHELQSTEPATTPANIVALRGRLIEVYDDPEQFIVMEGRCHEPVRLDMPVETLAQEGIISRAVIAATGLAKHILHIRRAAGQAFKPRSSATETLPGGRVIDSFMGDGINSPDPDHRVPDPSRLVGTATQARDVRRIMDELAGEHVHIGHEALSLPYEQAFVREDPQTGARYLLSADLPWIGERTNKLDGPTDNPHVELLTGLENPVGVKLGPTSGPDHIRDLAERLNPDRERGKLVFMIRVGENIDAMDRILAGIQQHAPEAMVLYDIHGSTASVDGIKVRSVDTTLRHIELLAERARAHGLRLHGIHVETQGDDRRIECVDHADELPNPHHRPHVDPQFGPRQLGDLAAGTAAILSR